MNRVGIVGGGIIGLSSAYYLIKRGFKVTIFDKTDLSESCSIGNAGMIVPSHIIPLASPGMISRGFRWMFNSSSPFYVKPRFNRDLIQWGYQFYKHSNKKHVERSVPALKNLSLYSKSLYKQWSDELPFDFGYKEKGLLMLYQNSETEKEELEAVHVANKAGVEAHILSSKEIQDLETQVRVTARGGVYYPGDAQIIPQLLVTHLISYLKQMGVVFQTSTKITGFQPDDRRIKFLTTDRGDFEVDNVVIAAGSWSGALLGMFEISVPMQAGKGYSFTLNDVAQNIQIPTIFLEPRVAVTPMGNSLRFGGTMEISGVDHSINMNRVKGIVNSIPDYYPDMKVGIPKIENVWHGLRPCSPDGLPYIGKSKKWINLTIATGHAMLGMSLAPGTGKIVSDGIMEEHLDLNIDAFDPERYDDRNRLK
ncbi:MAG: FAD-dependent oxidoreductase [Cyclobacteriaceae bacterium]|nr:FAD-dependent oxidoreductase [Cyclobacteriaceae bacterium]